jgi:peptidoglycan/LPS O-acetylase OafA/YrhL
LKTLQEYWLLTELNMTIEKLAPGMTATEKNTTRPAEKGFWVLNWLRFLLAFYLVLFHTLRPNYDAVKHSWVGNALSFGNWGTSVFFVLSGFLLTHAYVVMKDGREIDRGQFFAARFSTLYPLHIVGLLLALIGSSTIYTQGGIRIPLDLSGTAERVLGTGETCLALLMNATLLHAWNPFYLAINYPSWSLSTLAFFYLVFPVLAPRVFRMRFPVRGLVVLGLLFLLPGAIAHLLHRTDLFTDGLLHRNPIIRLPLFVAGMVLCVVYARSSRKVATMAQVALLVGVVLLTAMVSLDLKEFSDRPHLVRNGLYFPASLAIIWLCAAARPITSRQLKYWGARLGAASLPLFLLHSPVFDLFKKAEKLLVAASQGGNVSSIVARARDIELSLLFFPLYAVFLIILCVVVQERFVMPLQAKIRNAVADRKARRLSLNASRTGTA